MSGTWLPPREKPHRCVLPKIDYTISVGARWQCDCGNIYEVEHMNQHGESWKAWVRDR